MFKLRIEVPEEEPLQRALTDEAFVATVHVDRAVQVVESEFDARFTPPPPAKAEKPQWLVELAAKNAAKRAAQNSSDAR